MSTEHVVLETQIEFAGAIHKAAYFVENGVIHADIDGKTMLLPVGQIPPDQTVQSMLRGHLFRLGTRSKRVAAWRNEGQRA